MGSFRFAIRSFTHLTSDFPFHPNSTRQTDDLLAPAVHSGLDTTHMMDPSLLFELRVSKHQSRRVRRKKHALTSTESPPNHNHATSSSPCRSATCDPVLASLITPTFRTCSSFTWLHHLSLVSVRLQVPIQPVPGSMQQAVVAGLDESYRLDLACEAFELCERTC
jgi:hypothetical protein